MMSSNHHGEYGEGIAYNRDDDDDDDGADDSSSECIYVSSDARQLLDSLARPSKIICTSGISYSTTTHQMHSDEQLVPIVQPPASTTTHHPNGMSSSLFLGRLKKNKPATSGYTSTRHHAWMKSAPINHSNTSSPLPTLSSSTLGNQFVKSQSSGLPFTSYKTTAPARPLDDGDEIDSDIEEIFIPTTKPPLPIVTINSSRLKAIPKMPPPPPSAPLLKRPSTIQSIVAVTNPPLKSPLNFQSYRTIIPSPTATASSSSTSSATLISVNNEKDGAFENITRLQEDARARFMPSSLMKSRKAATSSTFTSYHNHTIITIETPEEKAQRIQARLDAMPLADQPVGIKTALHKHQRQALNWLLARENDGLQFPHNDDIGAPFETLISLDSTATQSVGVRGSILADDMGLGKTLELISLMVVRPVPLTLIVCPMALLKQWENQINEHANKNLFKVVQYYGPNPSRDLLLTKAIISNRLELRANWPNKTISIARSMFQNIVDGDDNDDGGEGVFTQTTTTSLVVITTYGMLLGGSAEEDEEEADSMAAPKIVKAKKRKNPSSRSGRKKSSSSSDEYINPLLAINWDRLIMDEAQAMKNNKAKTTKAAIQLKWRYAHLLTGTPLQNKIAEFQSLMMVLKHPRYSDISNWESDMTYSPDCSKNMSILMDAITLRRVKEQKILGEVIVSLPPVTYHDVPISLIVGSTEEIFYSAVESKICDEFNAIVSKYGEKMAMKNYTYILVLLLRLRQVACHPYLFAISNLYHGDEGKKRRRSKQKGTNCLLEVTLLDAFCSRFIEAYRDSVENGSIGKSNYDDDDDDGIMVVYEVGNSNDAVGGLLDGGDEEVDESMHAEEDDQLLFNEEEDHELFSSFSSHAKRVLPPIFNRDFAPNDDADVAPIVDKEEDDHSLLAKMENDEDNSSSSMLQLTLPHDCTYMSSKLRFAMDIVTRIAVDSPNDKIVIFSLFDGFLDVMQYHFQKLLPPSIRGSRISRIDGKTVNSSRNDIITNFKLKSTLSHRIIFLALKAAGVGLDLSVANHILIMDPWWNSAMERQAQDRVYRIGQKKPVSIYKFILKGSVEERIALIQAKKESMIQAAMGDVTLLPPERLTFANISIMLKPIVRK